VPAQRHQACLLRNFETKFIALDRNAAAYREDSEAVATHRADEQQRCGRRKKRGSGQYMRTQLSVDGYIPEDGYAVVVRQ